MTTRLGFLNLQSYPKKYDYSAIEREKIIAELLG
jgi:hypothetical protein